ncbi:MAG: hypothetical protein LBB91_07125 [Clostridiales bacterium]|jgi:hypothetical protein|nr:hypothetical protein [Clostridiales bacterium]
MIKVILYLLHGNALFIIPEGINIFYFIHRELLLAGGVENPQECLLQGFIALPSGIKAGRGLENICALGYRFIILNILIVK